MDRHSKPRAMRLAAFALLIGALAAFLPPAQSSVVHAQSDGNGLEETSINTFFIDPTAGVVKVRVDITIKNVIADRREGNFIRQTFVNAYGVVVPAGAENIVATQNGRTLSGELLMDDPDEPFSFYQFDLRSRVFFGQSARVEVTYDHTGLPPRSDITWRANSAYTSYIAFGLGDAGRVTIEILQPAGYDFDDFTDLTDFEASEPNEFGVVTHRRENLDEDFSVSVGLSNDDQLLSTAVEVEGVDLEIRSWPGDEEWLDFATETVETGVPELEALIGSAWPPEGEFEIRQTVEPYFYGYAGWFDSAENEIAVGEDLDADTLYHELSHAWFNGDLFAGRWLSEGFAHVYAAELTDRDGDEALEPSKPRTRSGTQPLQSWTAFGSSNDDLFEAREEYGYNASFWVMQELVDEIGFDTMSTIITATDAQHTAYIVDGEDPARRTTTAIDWRYMLDYFERIGGSTEAEQLFRDYVVTEAQFDDLDERRSAIAAYDELADRVGPWTMPRELRNKMDRWAFGRASELTEAANTVLDRRGVLEERADSTGIDAVGLDGADETFVSATDDFVELIEVLESDIAAGDTLIERQATVADKAAAIGTVPPALDSGDAGAPTGFAAATEVAIDQIDALDRLSTAVAIVDAERTFTQRIGLYGEAPEDDIEAARSAIESGDNDLARSHLDAAVDTVESATELGKSRLTISIIGAAAIALTLLAALVFFVRRRRRRRAQAASVEALSGSGDVDDIEVGERRVDLDEDALAGTGLSGMDDVGDVAGSDDSEAAGSAGVVERTAVLGNVGDPVLELDEHVGTVVDADAVSGAEVLIDPNSHDGAER